MSGFDTVPQQIWGGGGAVGLFAAKELLFAAARAEVHGSFPAAICVLIHSSCEPLTRMPGCENAPECNAPPPPSSPPESGHESIGPPESSPGGATLPSDPPLGALPSPFGRAVPPASPVDADGE